ncbi:type VII secretion protein EccB [Natronoglycomyces albus]|uniref:Type VII secretion protein EccB n=1 Tax=Natronoglycomyces albus TaxID=2811108 RepID=A0A895XJS7_9ACTN|nr:type VII secretion protein EccB [Natronoglycomyces albus]QSB06011.1 type VII secretion protein EccB [Natronoglycomyces albus]
MVQMRSRREQVDAHRYTTQRMNLALLMANPESTERPLRRVGMSIFASTMIMVIIMGIFLLVGLLGFGSSEPEHGNIVMDRDTGEVYIYEHQTPGDPNSPLVLFPVLNYTSALLALDFDPTGEPPVQRLKQDSIDPIPKAHPIGIVGAPSAPTRNLDQDSKWNVCSIQAQDDHDFLFTQVAHANLSGGESLAENEAMLVHTEQGDQYLLWNNQRMAIPDSSALTPFGWHSSSDSTEVTKEFLNTLVAGPDFWHPDLPEFGEDSGESLNSEPIAYGTPVTDGENHYVLIRNSDDNPEFARISPMIAQLLEVDSVGDLTQATLAELSRIGTEATVHLENANFPQDIDQLRTLDGPRPTVCGVFEPHLSQSDSQVKVTTFAVAPSFLTDAADNQEFTDEGDLITGNPAQIVMKGGTGALVQAQPRPGQNLAPAQFLVDDLGIKYELVDYKAPGETKNKLGYNDVEPVGIPSSFIHLMPPGPNLDPFEARGQLNPTEEFDPYDPGEDDEDDDDGDGESDE